MLLFVVLFQFFIYVKNDLDIQNRFDQLKISDYDRQYVKEPEYTLIAILSNSYRFIILLTWISFHNLWFLVIFIFILDILIYYEFESIKLFFF